MSGAIRDGGARGIGPHDTGDRRRRIGAASIAIALALFGAALVPRILYVSQTRDLSYFAGFALDGEWYRQRAHETLSGRPLSEESHFRGPLYGWTLAGLFSLAGESVHAVRVAQVLLGAANGVLVWIAASRLVSPPAAVVASLLYAGYGMLVFFDGEVLTLTLEITLLLLFLIALTDRRRIAAPLSGAVLGLAALVRPAALPLALPAIAYLATEAGRFGKRMGGAGLRIARPTDRALAAAGFLAGLVLVVAPVIFGYHAILGDWIPISSQGGINFYLGNHAGADGSASIAPSTGDVDLVVGDRYRDTVAEGSTRVAERVRGRALLPSEVSSYWYGRGLSFARANPGEFAALFAKRLYLVVSNQETDNNQALRLFVERHARWLLAMPVGAALIVGLGLVSLPWRWRSATREQLLALAAVVVMWLSTAAFLVIARYRVPLLILLLPFAGATLVALASAARARAWRSFAARALPAAALVALASAGLHTAHSEGVLAAQHVNLGVMEERAGNDAAAIDEYRAALALEPGLVQARYAIGNALARLGRSAEARREYEALLANDERYAPFVSNSLGIIALEEGDAPAAVVAFRRALEGDPAPTTHANLGVALLTLWEEMKNRSLRARWPDGIVRNAAGDSVGYASAPSAAWSASVLDSVTLAKPEMIIDEAIDELGTAWRSGQVPGDVGVDLARARLAAGDTARAESDLREVVQRDQSTLRAWLLTAEIARARNDRVVEAGALGCALILRPDLGDARARLAELRAAR